MTMMVLSIACRRDSTNGDGPTRSELEKALASGRPTVAGFVGQECGCKNMRPTLEDLAVEYDGICNVVIIDATENKDLAGQYAVVVTPTRVFLDSSGAETDRIVGSSTRAEIVDRLAGMGV